MRHETTTVLLALLVPLASTSCSDPGRSDSTLLDTLERVWAPAGQESALPVGANCRSVAVQRSVRVNGASGESSCQFDRASSELACRTGLGRSGELTTSSFASPSDFVEAAHTLGKVTSLRELRRQGDSEWISNHEYDELGRLLRSRERRPEGELVYSYSDYDDAGRPRQALPTRATQQAWDCEAAAIDIEYAAATVSYHYQPPGGCGTREYSIVEQYDALGNRVRVERSGADGVETTFEASAPLATQTVCD
jgi:hypothetical protein